MPFLWSIGSRTATAEQSTRRWDLIWLNCCMQQSQLSTHMHTCRAADTDTNASEPTATLLQPETRIISSG